MNDDGAVSARYPRTLLILFGIWWLAWAYKPILFSDWVLENVLTVLTVGTLAFTRRRFPLSNISYTLFFVFLVIHTVGAHYSYSEVPYGQWSQAVLGTGIDEMFGFERNHYDRLVHFSFGLLLSYPIREYALRIVAVRGFWGYWLPLDVTMSFSLAYELIEWGAAVVFGGELGQAFLGTQGDVWDAQKDMGLATLGAVITMSVVAAVNWRYNRRFGEELLESLAVKEREPLGEVRVQKWREENSPKS